MSDENKQPRPLGIAGLRREIVRDEMLRHPHTALDVELTERWTRDGERVEEVARLQAALNEALDLLVEFMDDSVGPSAQSHEVSDDRVIRLRKLAREGR